MACGSLICQQPPMACEGCRRHRSDSPAGRTILWVSAYKSIPRGTLSMLCRTYKTPAISLFRPEQKRSSPQSHSFLDFVCRGTPRSDRKQVASTLPCRVGSLTWIRNRRRIRSIHRMREIHRAEASCPDGDFGHDRHSGEKRRKVDLAVGRHRPGSKHG